MLKRIFDIFFSLLSIQLLIGLLLISWLLACIDTRSNGVFLQNRVGQNGKPFTIYKLKTIRANNVVSKLGAFLRKYKLDELPQLINVLKGDMSVVGPRPDIIGYYDQLKGENRKILTLKPGLTSLAAIKYANEEAILKQQENMVQYNNEVIFPDKVELNLKYYYSHSFWGDIEIIGQTFFVLFISTINKKI